MTEIKNNTYPWLDELPQLNSLLSAKGIPVSADVWVRVYDLFIAQYQQSRLPKDPASLESALSSLMVTSAEQQQTFRRVYQQWLSNIGSTEAAQAKQNEKARRDKELEEFEQQQEDLRKNRSLKKIIAIAALLFAILIFAVIYFLPVPEPEPEPEPPVAPPTTPTISTAQASQPVMALQQTPLRKDLLPKAQSASQQYLLEVIGRSLPYLPIGLFLFFLWARWQRWQEVLSQQKGNPKDPLSAISLPPTAESSERLFSSPLLSNALRALHNPIKVPSQTLSMEATAEATANAGGYFTPKYQQRAYIPPCIMMISYQHGQDQASGLALLMQQRLLHAGLEVHTYLFQGTPEHLYTLHDMKSTSLEEVTMRFPQGNLLLISDPDIYLSAWSGELQPWASVISQWSQRALLTTRPTTAAMRKAFDTLQLHSASLSTEGLKQISQTLAGVRKARDISTPQTPLPPVLARLNAYDCGEAVSKEDQHAHIEALHLFCDPQTFRLLSVIAAYPELHWPLTQRIESELCAEQPMAQREQRLLNLLRLPWLRAGKIPKWLRLYCYQEQSAKQHQETKILYRKLFHQAEIEAAGNSLYDHLQLPFNPNASKSQHQAAFLRWLKTLKQAQESTLEESIWEDQIFVDTLWGKPKDLDVPLTRKLAVRLPKGRWGRLYPRIALWGIAAGLLGIVLHQVWQDTGRAELQALLPPAGLSVQLANSTIEITINKPEKYETGAQLQQFEQQKQAATLLTKALKQQGIKGEINTHIVDAAANDQASNINYTAGQLELAELAAIQFVHLTWGNTPELSATATSDTLQIQLNTLTQAASTFSDQAKPLSDVQKLELAMPITKFNSASLQAFTLFSDVSKDNVPLPQMVALPAGEFLMGSPETEPDRRSDESPQHTVTLNAFAISQTEITFDQYDAFAEATKRDKPSDQGWGRGQRPVINVNWNDAKAYTTWLSEQTGQVYRLPTEAEWEYAARAGTQTPFSTGDCIRTDLANYDGADSNSFGSKYYDCGAKTDNYRKQTTLVSELAPNPWGLYAMHGNVWEWVEDCYKDSYVGAPDDGSARQEAECTSRVLRGGGWGSRPSSIRSAIRNGFNPGEAFSSTGFRIARAL